MWVSGALKGGPTRELGSEAVPLLLHLLLPQDCALALVPQPVLGQPLDVAPLDVMQDLLVQQAGERRKLGQEKGVADHSWRWEEGFSTYHLFVYLDANPSHHPRGLYDRRASERLRRAVAHVSKCRFRWRLDSSESLERRLERSDSSESFIFFFI